MDNEFDYEKSIAYSIFDFELKVRLNWIKMENSIGEIVQKWVDEEKARGEKFPEGKLKYVDFIYDQHREKTHGF